MTTPTYTNLIDWYAQWFKPPDADHYALMQPKGDTDKYRRRHEVPTLELLTRAFTGPDRLSVALTPQTRDGSALAAILDIDDTDPQAVTRVLATAARYGLWAVAFLSARGAHVYIPVTAPLPAELLRNLATRLQAAAGVRGEVYPSLADLRLPFMAHLRAEGGPRRFPALLQTGELIDASDPWQAIADLRDAWQPNPPEAITAAAWELPDPTPEKPVRLHKSKVNPLAGPSVIDWYCDNYALGELLEAAGGKAAKGHGSWFCPFHDDKSPSLWVFNDEKTQRRKCYCLSKHSNCPAHEHAFDAFNVLCHIEGLTASEAVKRLVERHDLGKRRTLQATTAQTDAPKLTPAEHAALIQARRVELAAVLRDAAMRRGEVTVIKGVPGIGKTHAAAELVEVQHAQDRRVAIASYTIDLAESEWKPRLTDPHVWKARREICTCYADKAPGYVKKLEDAGFFVECIKEDCPYKIQARQLPGRVGIFQHAHLTLPESKPGRALAMADLIIIDESPLNAILTERSATLGELRALARRMGEHDPARALVLALADIADEHGRGADLYGSELLTRLADRLGDVGQAIQAAQKSPLATLTPIAPLDCDPDALPRQFLGRLLRALAHDATGTGNALVTWGKAGNGWGWVWYDPASFLAHAANRLERPAVIVLDGSADLTVSERLYRAWPVRLVELDAPLSPAVELIQVTTGASTRRIVEDAPALESMARRVAMVANAHDLTLDALVSYKAAAPVLAETLGIDAARVLGYGAQRGRNTLQDARALAIVASPTAPPASIERKARALWSDAAPIDHTWQRVATGFYQAVDPRLEAINRLHGPEELRQSIHRARPILATDPMTLLVFTPWPLASLGFTPTATIDALPYGNSNAARDALVSYQARTRQPSQDKLRGGGLTVSPLLTSENHDLQSRIRNTNLSPQIVNQEIQSSVSHLLAIASEVRTPPPLSTLGEDFAPAPVCECCYEAPAVTVTSRGPLCAECIEWHNGLQAAPLVEAISYRPPVPLAA